MAIAITNVQLGPDVEASVLGVIRSGMIAQGPVVAQLEKSFAEMTDVKHVVAVNNGTTALIAALEVLDKPVYFCGYFERDFVNWSDRPLC